VSAPAHQRTDRDRDADGGAVQAHRHGALATGREFLGDQGQGDGEQHRPAHALERARQAEQGRIRRQRAQQRSDREDRQPGGEHPAAPQPVGQRAGRQHQRRQRQRVGVDHPLQVGEAGAEVLAD
jgi:hypothetical protein